MKLTTNEKLIFLTVPFALILFIQQSIIPLGNYNITSPIESVTNAVPIENVTTQPKENKIITERLSMLLADETIPTLNVDALAPPVTTLSCQAIFWAMRQVEQGGNRNPYEISAAYWYDACEYAKIDWDYNLHKGSETFSEYIILAYAHRYEAEDYQDLILLHNGGPTHRHSKMAHDYWVRVNALAEEYIVKHTKVK